MKVHHISIYFSGFSLPIFEFMEAAPVRWPASGPHRGRCAPSVRRPGADRWTITSWIVDCYGMAYLPDIPQKLIVIIINNYYSTYFFGVSCATAIFWRGPSNTAVPINQVWECLMLSGSEAWSSLDGVGFAKHRAMLYPRLGDYPKVQELLRWATWMTTKHWSISAGSHLILWNIHRR